MQVGTARAAIFERAGQPMRIAELPLPSQLAEGEALVAISRATICGSDLHTHGGRRQEKTPCILGHEGVGRIVAAGITREAWLGKRVTWTLADSCGTCAACASWDLPQKCDSVFKYGHACLHDGNGLHGTYASHILLRRGTHLVEVPDHISDAVAASANCSLATMANVVEELPKPCHVALIQGAGLLGLHACALLRSAGVEHVFVVDTDKNRLAQVARFGGEAVESTALPARSVDVVIEAAGVPSLVPEALRLLRFGGHYLFVGMVHPDSYFDLSGEALIRGCITLRGFHNYAPRHLEHAVKFLSESSLPWDSLVSPPLPLEQIEDAFALSATRRWARVAVTMEP